MNKDTCFSIGRLVLLTRKDMVENWKTIALRATTALAIMTVILVVTAWITYSSETSSGFDHMVNKSLTVFCGATFIFGCLLASTTFDKMKHKTSRLSTLMTPGTQFEKFFSRWFLYTLVYLVAFTFIFMLADYGRVIFGRLAFPETTVVPTNLKYLFTPYGDRVEGFEQFKPGATLLGYFFIQSFFVLGSSVWPRNSFIKSFAAGFGIVVSYILFNVLMLRLLIGENVIINNDTVVNPNVVINLSMAVLAAFTLFNWTMAYFRFKESELIERM